MNKPPTSIGMHTRRFTLVELMVAMFLVAVLTLFLMRSLIISQRAWDLSESTSRIFESSRVVFDLIEHDVKSMTTSPIPGFEIGYFVGEPDPDGDDADDCLHFCVVASTEPDELSAKSRLCEISYKHHIDESTSNPSIKPFVLTRQLIAESDSANWDFLGLPSNWEINNKTGSGGPADFETIVRGVEYFAVKFYDTNGDLIPAGTDTFVRPTKAVFDMILFDENLADAPEAVRYKTKRAFTKVVYLDYVINSDATVN